MRILLATDHYPPFIGGAHRWAELVAHGLARRGHKVTVVTEWHGGLPREERCGEVSIHRVRQLRTMTPRQVRDRRQRHSPPFPDPVTVRDLREVIDAAKPDVVVAHGWIASSAAVAVAGKDVPLMLSVHDYGNFCATRTLLQKGKPCSGPAPRKCLACAADFYGGAAKGAAAVGGVALTRRILSRSCAAVHSVSVFVDDITWQNVFATSGSKGSVRRYVIPAFLDVDPPKNGRDLERIANDLARLPREPFILFVGALRATKGIHVLLDAYVRLSDPPPLVLMGTLFEDTPTQFPPGVVPFVDVPHPVVMEAWGRALIGVVPSVWPEPLGTVSIEGISRGKPMVATEPGGMVDVLGDGAGILVPRGDVAALAGAMQSLLDNPALRDQLGRVGLARSARFEAEVVLSQYEHALAEVVGSRAAAASD